MTSILAIDPGNVQSGYVIFAHGEIAASGVVDNRVALKVIDDFYHRRVSTEPARSLVIEGMAAMGMPVGKEVLDTCRWIGRYEERAEGRWGMQSRIVYRRDIKLHFCGQARAKDQNIRQALIDRLGKPGTKANKGPTYGITSHAWSALAVALYALDNPEET